MTTTHDAIEDFWAGIQNSSGVPAQWAGRLSLEEAVQVQLGISERWEAAGVRRAGWKVGATNKAVQAQLGVDGPAFGIIHEDAVLWTGRALQVGAAVDPHVESELCFRVDGDLGDARTIAEVAEHVTAVHPAFEIIEKRLPMQDLPLAIADNAESWRIVLGPPVTLDPALDLAAVRCTLVHNGEGELTATGDVVLGNPLNSLLWLRDRLRGLGRSLRAGDLVMTGSFLPQRPLRAGDHVRADFSGIGSVELTAIP